MLQSGPTDGDHLYPQQEQYGEVMKFNLEKQGAHIPCSLSISWEQELHLYGRM